MTRLGDAGVKNLVWSEDEDGTVSAAGHRDYEIDENNEVAIFDGPKCIGIREAKEFAHAVSIVLANENVCAYEIRSRQ